MLKNAYSMKSILMIWLIWLRQRDFSVCFSSLLIFVLAECGNAAAPPKRRIFYPMLGGCAFMGI